MVGFEIFLPDVEVKVINVTTQGPLRLFGRDQWVGIQGMNTSLRPKMGLWNFIVHVS